MDQQDNWDPVTANGNSTSNFGSGAGVRVGVGRGYSKITPKPVAAQPSLGFDSTDDGWNEDTAGNGDSSSGFQGSQADNRSSNNFNGGGDVGWRPKSSGESGSRGGFHSGGGGGGGGGQACFGCGAEGHRKSECPQATSRGRGCFNCGEEGHIGKDCTQPKKGGGMTCYNCQEEGHRSSECTKPKAERRGGGGMTCYNCQEEGHRSSECTKPKAERRGGGGRGNNTCFKCNEEGHMSRECPNSDSSGGRGNNTCFKCNEEGHISRDCPNSDSGGGRSNKCYKCGNDGHMAKDCTEEVLDKDGKPREAPYVPVDRTDNEDELFEGISSGLNFDKYESIKVSVNGRNPPPPISSFEDANIRELLRANIKRAHYVKPTPVQKNCIPIVLAGRDLMACAQTGSGKTAAFMVPIVNAIMDSDLESGSFNQTQEPIAVILSPTRELAIQIYSEAKKFAHNTIVHSVVVYGGTSINHQIRQLQNGCHILVATPGRLVDFVEKGKISFSRLKYLVLDEADRMLDMGFISAIRSVVDHSTTPKKGERHTLMFSATFPPEIQKLASEFLASYIFVAIGEVGAANQDVEQIMYQIGKFDKVKKLEEILENATTNNQKVLVFVETKRGADYVASVMSQKGFPTTSIHGDRMQREREEALGDFRTGKYPVLIATAVAARGLDIKNVANVVNYDLPKSIDEYVHRIGRTGRVGNTGKAISFYDPNQDQQLARPLVKILAEALQPVPDWLEAEGGSGGYAAEGGAGFGARDIRGHGAGEDGWGSHESSAGQFAAEEAWD